MTEIWNHIKSGLFGYVYHVIEYVLNFSATVFFMKLKFLFIVLFIVNEIFHMKLSQYNDCIFSIVNTDVCMCIVLWHKGIYSVNSLRPGDAYMCRQSNHHWLIFFTYFFFFFLGGGGGGGVLSPRWQQPIIWTNAEIFINETLRSNFCEILIRTQTFSFKKMHLKPLSGKLWPFFLGLTVLTHWGRLNQCWTIVNWTLGNKLYWNLYRNMYIFIQENAFENVLWKMEAILFRPQCVNDAPTHFHLFKVSQWQIQTWFFWILILIQYRFFFYQDERF